MAEKFVGIVPHKTNDLSLNSLATVITTVGGVDITTNLSPSTEKSYLPPKFSTFYTLESVGEISLKKSLLNPEKQLQLSLNYTNAKYFAKYGSLFELVRVSLETIALKFPASIYSKTNVLGSVGSNVINSGYYYIDDTTTFQANVSYFSNPFNIYFLNNENYKFPDERTADLRNLSKNYYKYELIVDGVTYPILEFTPSKKSTNDFCAIKVKGNPFELGSSSTEFYIKPIETEFDKFYDSLEPFELYLVNRNGNNAIFQATEEVDGGIFLDYLLSIEFPMRDLYNLDMTSTDYEVYLTDLLAYAEKFDEEQGNLLMRKLVPDSVQSVTLEDINATYPTYGEINRLLIVYGRNLDNINQYIEGIRFLNTVSYNSRDSIPDALLPEFVRMLGWDLDVNPTIPTEQLRLLALNSSWIFKSKGTRKAVEFLLNFFGVPLEIVDYNEHVIRAKKPIDVEQLKFYYSLISPASEFDIELLPIDENGYPKYFIDTDLDYFQRYGEIDRGNSYFYKYVNLFPPEFTGATVTYVEDIVTYKTLFEQDFDGTGNTLAYDIVDSSLITNECYTVTGETVPDPYPEIFLDECGCPLPISDSTLKICVEPKSLSGCTTIIADIWYDCISGSTAILHINPIGGTAPYEFFGASGEQIVSTGDTFNIYVTDSKGCSSAIYSITIDCPDPCLSTDLVIDLSYDCILDEFGRNTGDAIINLTHNGTWVSGVVSGDTITDGEIASVIVQDLYGCVLTQTLLIECPIPSALVCDQEISANISIETTSIQFEEYLGKMNVVYDLEPVPVGYIIDTVTMTVEVGTNAILPGGLPVIQTFNSLTGVKTVDLDFTGFLALTLEIPSTLTAEITLDIVFIDACEYSTTNSLTINPRLLGDNDETTVLMIP